MAKYSMKKGGKEVGPANVYAAPHTMDGKPSRIQDAQEYMTDPNSMTAVETTPAMPARRVSAGNPNREQVKTSGIKIRGTGAATKGVMARGPMA